MMFCMDMVSSVIQCQHCCRCEQKRSQIQGYANPIVDSLLTVPSHCFSFPFTGFSCAENPVVPLLQVLHTMASDTGLPFPLIFSSFPKSRASALLLCRRTGLSPSACRSLLQASVQQALVQAVSNEQSGGILF